MVLKVHNQKIIKLRLEQRTLGVACPLKNAQAGRVRLC